MMQRSLRALLAVLVLLLLGAAGGCTDVDVHTVTVWHAYRGDEEKAIAQIARDYEKAHPSVRIELLALPFDAYQSKLKAAIPHGHGPDLFIEAHERSNVYQRHALLAPIPFALDDDYDPVVTAAVTQGGVRVAIPLSAKCVALYVRTDLGGPTPRSMDELLARPLPAGVFPLAYEANNAYLHAAILSAYGGSLVSGAEFSFDSSAGVASMRFVHGAMAQKKIPEEPTGALVTQLFGSGKAAAIIDGPWLRADLPKGLAYEVVPLPTLEGHRMRPLLTVEAAFLTPQGAARADALDFARFLGSREAALTLATVGHQVVARRAAWTDPALTSDKALVAFHEAVAEAIPTPASEAMNAAWVPANDALHNVLRGQEPQATLIEAHRRFDDAMKPPPPARSPGTLYLALGLAGLGLAFLGVKRARQPGFRAELKASMPAYRYVLHSAGAIVVLVILPLTAGALASFYSGTRDDPQYVGLSNYVSILTARGGPLLGHGSFYVTLLVTVLWTVVNVALHLLLGVVLGLLLSRPLLRLRAAYRVLLILPWAVPSYVTALAWKGMFHRQFGAINGILVALGAEPVSWFSRFSTAFSANVATNVWLGFPFMMVVTLGALTSIPKDVLEAADVDGATRWQRFWLVTYPLLRPALMPAVVLGSVWTFNMFNVVFLVSGGEPDGSTDILVSDAYRWAFTRDAQYGYAAAYAVLIFLMLFFTTRLARKQEAAA